MYKFSIREQFFHFRCGLLVTTETGYNEKKRVSITTTILKVLAKTNEECIFFCAQIDENFKKYSNTFFSPSEYNYVALIVNHEWAIREKPFHVGHPRRQTLVPMAKDWPCHQEKGYITVWWWKEKECSRMACKIGSMKKNSVNTQRRLD